MDRWHYVGHDGVERTVGRKLCRQSHAGSNSGIGIWTEQMFVDAIRTGKHMGVSRPILPPMPWQALRSLNDEDLKSIFAYLKSLPGVSNHVPDPIQPTATH